MVDQGVLVDISVLGRAHQPLIGERLVQLASDRRMWSCRLIDLEVIYGSRSRDVAAVIAERLALPEARITPAVVDRAVRVAGMLADAGHHREAKPVDLVVAAAAESHGLVVLHYDADYERIAEVTGQATEWVSAAGSLDR